MRCAIWYYLCNLKNVKNTHGGVRHEPRSHPIINLTVFYLLKDIVFIVSSCKFCHIPNLWRVKIPGFRNTKQTTEISNSLI